MNGWNGCKDCRGKGVKPIPGGVASCHARPPVVDRMNGVNLNAMDVERMTACG